MKKHRCLKVFTPCRLFTVAHALSESHVQAAKLKGEGYTLKKIADKMRVSPTRVNHLLTGLKIHLRHFELTGKLPTTQTTKNIDRKTAAEIVETYLAKIGRRLGINPKSVGKLMNSGAHVVFGIEPQGSRAAKLYNEIRRKHADLFT